MRYLRNTFIAVFLALQIALPLHYYLGYSDPYDERFAWRMYSTTRMASCRLAFVADGRPVQLGRRFHQGWISLAQRGRRQVVDAMARKLCADPDIRQLHLTMTCGGPEQPTRTIAAGGFDLCKLGGL